MNNDVVFIRTQSLPLFRSVEKIYVVCFFKGKIMLLVNGSISPEIPAIVPEACEDVHKTIRREIFNMSGALLDGSKFIGSIYLKKKNKYIPVFSCTIADIENTPLMPDNYSRLFVAPEEVYSLLNDKEWIPVRSAVLFYSFEVYKKASRKN